MILGVAAFDLASDDFVRDDSQGCCLGPRRKASPVEKSRSTTFQVSHEIQQLILIERVQ